MARCVSATLAPICGNLAEQGALRRRDFLDVCVGGTIALGAELSGCSNAGATTVSHGACHHDCPDTCASLVTTRNRKIVKLEADKNHPQDLALSEWLTHTPPELVMAHLNLDRATLDAMPKTKAVILPE